MPVPGQQLQPISLSANEQRTLLMDLWRTGWTPETSGAIWSTVESLNGGDQRRFRKAFYAPERAWLNDPANGPAIARSADLQTAKASFEHPDVKAVADAGDLRMNAYGPRIASGRGRGNPSYSSGDAPGNREVAAQGADKKQ